MQTFDHSLHTFLIIYELSAFPFFDSGWQSIHDVSVYLQFLSLILDGFSLNKVVVATKKIRNERKKRKEARAKDSNRRFDLRELNCHTDKKRPKSAIQNRRIQSIHPD